MTKYDFEALVEELRTAEGLGREDATAKAEELRDDLDYFAAAWDYMAAMAGNFRASQALAA